MKMRIYSLIGSALMGVAFAAALIGIGTPTLPAVVFGSIGGGVLGYRLIGGSR